MVIRPTWSITLVENSAIYYKITRIISIKLKVYKPFEDAQLSARKSYLNFMLKSNFI